MNNSMVKRGFCVSFVLIIGVIPTVETTKEFGDHDWVNYSTQKEHVGWAATVDAGKHVALVALSN